MHLSACDRNRLFKLVWVALVVCACSGEFVRDEPDPAVKYGDTETVPAGKDEFDGEARANSGLPLGPFAVSTTAGIPGLAPISQSGTGSGPAVVGANGTIDLGTSDCFNKPTSKLWELADGRYQRPFVPKGSVGDTYDLRGVKIEGNPLQFPVLLENPHDTCIVGVTTEGQQSRALSWQQMKKADSFYTMDGDGLGWENSSGKIVIEGAWIDNFEDGIGPPYDLVPDPTTSFSLRHVYLRYIRDDAIENDGCLSGEVIDSFFDGIWTFSSTRPGKLASRASEGEATLKVRDTLIRHTCMPDPRSKNNGCDGSTGTGELFKSHRSCKLSVEMENVVMLKEGARRGDDFLPGSYKNVTVVWAGEGDYPGDAVPPGVTLTTDRSVWDKARAAWIERHGCDDNAENCQYLHAENTETSPPANDDPYLVILNSPGFAPVSGGSGITWWAENVRACTSSGRTSRGKAPDGSFEIAGALSGSTRAWHDSPHQEIFTITCKTGDGATIADSDRAVWFDQSDDTQQPSTPAGLRAEASGEGIALAWEPSKDNTAIASYRIYRDGNWLVSVSGRPLFVDRAVEAGRRYEYAVQALDAFGNLSAKSAATPAVAQ